MSEYQRLVRQYTIEIEALSRKYNQLSYVRLGVGLFILLFIFALFKTGNYYWGLAIILTGIVFVVLVNIHQRISGKKRLSETLRTINQDEINFLEGVRIFEDGREYTDPHHLYSYDLDIFGPHSLFQYLNRTTTYRGSQWLAKVLLNRLSRPEILENQQAISELTTALDLRQKIQALGLMHRDDQELHQFILQWAKQRGSLSRITRISIYFLPVCLFLFLLIFAFTLDANWLNFATTVFILNLLVLGNSFKKIKSEISGFDRLDGVLRHYGLMLKEIETSTFKTARLKGLKESILVTDATASLRLKELAYLLNQLESVLNGVAFLLFSGSIGYHLHMLRKVYLWKDTYADQVPEWLEVIAQFEMLSSLANFKFNNPAFAFPEISEQAEMSFKDLGHPLVKDSVRVDNDIHFNEHRFMILTGSNMSGKSTFLRSIGVNTILACAGAPVCATEATIFPFKVLVSMRVADSLAESESYFYAEVKRLKQITEQLGSDHCLVLLDEILRGTNSDDKRNGTLEVIRRMVRENAYGMIATHDLEICKETENHPSVLANKCFEVEIKDDELYFDFKLRSGICVNQSATFLMKKNGII